VRKLVLASAFVANDGLLPEVRASFGRASVENMPEAIRAAYLEAAPEPDKLPVLVDKLMRRLTSFVDIPESDLRAIGAPTLVMIGDADIVTPEHALHMARLIPDAQLAIFPGADHGSYLGEVTAARTCEYCPDVVVAMVEEFLDAAPPR
jgi:pimeloyl-ACP methyl ester carboxylesterase